MVSYIMTKKQIFFILVGLILLMLFVIILPFQNKIYPNIYIANVYLGDKTKQQAVENIRNIKLKDTINLKNNG